MKGQPNRVEALRRGAPLMHHQCINEITINVWDTPGLQDGTKHQDQYDETQMLDLTMYFIETRFVRGPENPNVLAMEKLTKHLAQ